MGLRFEVFETTCGVIYDVICDVYVVAAEYEASALDILVCGNCQGVFHFAEEFQEHKAKNDCEKADKTNLNVQVSNVIFVIVF